MSSSPLIPPYLERVVIEDIQPLINGGRFPLKRCLGDEVRVGAAIHTDGVDAIRAVVRFRRRPDADWDEAPLAVINAGKDAWEGRFTVDTIGMYEYVLQAWIDPAATWRLRLGKKAEARQDIEQELREGARFLSEAAARAKGSDLDFLRRRASVLGAPGEISGRLAAALDETLAQLLRRYDRRECATLSPTFQVRVDRERARAGAWYEMFPRSAGTRTSRSATLREAEERLDDIARMGFDVVYLPPVHPIGKSFRKGPNNSPAARPEDPGSPWAIGSDDGGHTAVHPELGTLSDFDHFVKTAAALNLEVALDLAYQCSPDHPYVRQHPEWFRHRPDGRIAYAENPPKIYEDIFPLFFECEAWQALWNELKDVVLFWARHGVRIFRADNPHTKPYRFWEWLIEAVQEQYPDAIFLAEAFTRPAVMRYLAKAGFSQSYTYFIWRNTKEELTEYLTELTQSGVREYLRPNLFTNTPDILSAFLQTGGRAAFQIRLILAATLSAAYGIYGPPFELCENRAFPGTEDYVDSEKYQIRQWEDERPGHIKQLITQVNQIRRDNAALRANANLRFYPVDNPSLLFYGKTTPDRSNTILVVVNLDPAHSQSGWVRVPRTELGLPEAYGVHDLLTDNHYQWRGESNYVKLDPNDRPAHIFQISHDAR